MHANSRSLRCLLLYAAPIFSLVAFAGSARADIFQWEYINPDDPSKGKRQSTMLAPDGAGVDAVPGADLSNRNLTTAYLVGADLTGANAFAANLTDADLSQADIANAYFAGATLTGANLHRANLTNAIFGSAYSYGTTGALLTGADFSDAKLTGANFTRTFLPNADFTRADVRGARFPLEYDSYVRTYRGGISLDQLYATASYQDRDLAGIDLSGNSLAGGILAGQNLANANFAGARLAAADFSGADVGGASFSIVYESFFGRLRGTGVSLSQLYSTASYQAHDLSGIELVLNNLAGGNFAGQNLSAVNFQGATLTGARFHQANLTDAQFDGANLADADLSAAVVRGANLRATNVTLAQLYSTASYLAHDLTGVSLEGLDLRGGNFAGQNLTNANFGEVPLSDANFTGAEVRGAVFNTDRGCNQAYVYCDLPRIGITLTQLYSTASYEAHDLSGVELRGNGLSGGNFAGQELTDANFSNATLTDADFTGARIQGTDFSFSPVIGGIPEGPWYFPTVADAIVRLTEAQLYSTASYQARNLSRVRFRFTKMNGWNFVDQNLDGADLTCADLSQANLANAYCDGATLMGADFTSADARGTQYLDLTGATTTNLIHPDGQISGLGLDADGLLVVRDYDGDELDNPSAPPIPITVNEHLVMGPGGTLRVVFEADAWNSTISFAPGIPVTLGGTLELAFAADVNLASQVGRTFDLFEWTGVNPTGAFAIASPYAWDLSNLYATGEVTFSAVPEASCFALAAAGAFGLTFYRRRKIP